MGTRKASTSASSKKRDGRRERGGAIAIRRICFDRREAEAEKTNGSKDGVVTMHRELIVIVVGLGVIGAGISYAWKTVFGGLERVAIRDQGIDLEVYDAFMAVNPDGRVEDVRALIAKVEGLKAHAAPRTLVLHDLTENCRMEGGGVNTECVACMELVVSRVYGDRPADDATAVGGVTSDGVK